MPKRIEFLTPPPALSISPPAMRRFIENQPGKKRLVSVGAPTKTMASLQCLRQRVGGQRGRQNDDLPGRSQVRVSSSRKLPSTGNWLVNLIARGQHGKI